MQDSPLNDKVLKDKRKKLKETFDRVMRVYHQEEPEHWAELKRREVEYEKKRLKKEQYYESVKHAQSVQIDEIPLPQMSTMPAPGIPQQRIPPPMSLTIPPFSVAKKSLDASEKPEQKKKDAPGCPPGPPINVFELSDLDTDAEDDPPLLRETDVNEDDQSDKESDRSMDSDRSEESDEADSDEENELPPIPGINKTVPSLVPSMASLPTALPPHPSTMAPPMVFRPPPLRPGLQNFGLRMPPGPPMGPRPGSVVPRMNIRMPPGPPAGLPPRMAAHHMKNQHKDVNKGLTTITAKPVIRFVVLF